MFSRRLIEIIACGGLAVTTPAQSIDRWFAPFCHTVRSREGQRACSTVWREVYNPDDRARMTEGAAYIAREHFIAVGSRTLLTSLTGLRRPAGLQPDRIEADCEAGRSRTDGRSALPGARIRSPAIPLAVDRCLHLRSRAGCEGDPTAASARTIPSCIAGRIGVHRQAHHGRRAAASLAGSAGGCARRGRPAAGAAGRVVDRGRDAGGLQLALHARPIIDQHRKLREDAGPVGPARQCAQCLPRRTARRSADRWRRAAPVPTRKRFELGGTTAAWIASIRPPTPTRVWL